MMNEMGKRIKEQEIECAMIEKQLKEMREVFNKNQEAIENFGKVIQQTQIVMKAINHQLENITERMKTIEEQIKTNESQQTDNNSNVVELDRKTYQSEE